MEEIKVWKEFCLCLLFEISIPRKITVTFKAEEILFSRVICSTKVQEANTDYFS